VRGVNVTSRLRTRAAGEGIPPPRASCWVGLAGGRDRQRVELRIDARQDAVHVVGRAVGDGAARAGAVDPAAAREDGVRVVELDLHLRGVAVEVEVDRRQGGRVARVLGVGDVRHRVPGDRGLTDAGGAGRVDRVAGGE